MPLCRVCPASNGRAPSSSDARRPIPSPDRVRGAQRGASRRLGQRRYFARGAGRRLHTNPTLTGQREALKSTDAGVAIARAAGRPQVSATVGLNRDLTRSGILDTGGKGPTLSGGLDVSYPLFNGGATRNGIRAAETRVEAGRATLRAVEGDVFTQAVAAYMDVIRDRAIVELNANNVKVLETNLQATSDRFEIGDLTRTDVAQSEARLQLGRSQLALAEGNLAASEATYRQVIGRAPGQLAPPPPLAAAARHRRGSGADRARQQPRPRRRHPPGERRRLRRPRRPRRPPADPLGRRQRHLCQCARRQ